MLFRSLIDTMLIDSQWIPHVTINYVVLLTSVDFYIIITFFWEAERAQMCGICAHRTDTIHNTVLVMNRYCSQTFSGFPMAKTSRLNSSKVPNVNTPAECNRTLMATGEQWFLMQIGFSNLSVPLVPYICFSFGDSDTFYYINICNQL